jgi:uncharacterized phiE125 gp8 family phage protein
MPSVLLTGPAIEPVSLAEAKEYLRVAHDDDDAVIEMVIAAARDYVEAATRRALIVQTWRHSRDAWPADGRIVVLPVPLLEVIAARVYAEDGTVQEVDPDAFVFDTISSPGVISFPPWSMPPPGRPRAGIELDFDAGYGAMPDDVPPPLKLAIRLLVAHWYENRAVITSGGEVAVTPVGVAALIARYRVLSL